MIANRFLPNQILMHQEMEDYIAGLVNLLVPFLHSFLSLA